MSKKVPRNTTSRSSTDGPDAGPIIMQDGAARAAGPAAGRALEPAQQEDLTMESILMKLQALNYERDFCRRKRPYRPPLSPVYFACQAPSSAGSEQFVYFAALAAWLLKSCGVAIHTPKEFDDPNTTINNLLGGCKALGFAPPTYPTTKLLQGWGKEVAGLVDALCDVVMERQGWAPQQISRSMPGLHDYEEDDADQRPSADIAEQALGTSPEASEEELAFLGARKSVVGPAASPAPDLQMLVATVDPTAWRLEVERVAPKLRITLAADARDWRQHLDAAAAAAKHVQAAWPNSQGALQRVLGEVSASLEKLGSREAALNASFSHLLTSYRAAREELGGAQHEYNRCTERLSEDNNELHRIVAALEDAKGQLDQRGSTLSDASPLVRIKGAIAGLKEELGALEVRIGVVSHSLLQLSLRDKQATLRDAAAAAGMGVGGSRGADAAKRQGKGGRAAAGGGGGARRASGSRR